ncbi:MAG: hypothetical protein RDU76_07590 [Candidatus Edwardsbacteria bacterium]|nr:hypothetical protein [Candidatus Edwardsbacteria bacterium]
MSSILEPKEWLSFIEQKKHEYDRYLNLTYIKRGFAYTVALFSLGYLYKLLINIIDDFSYIYALVILQVIYIIIKRIFIQISDIDDSPLTLPNIPHSKNIEITRLETISKLFMEFICLLCALFIYYYSNILGFSNIATISMLIILWQIIILISGIAALYFMGPKLLFYVMTYQKNSFYKSLNLSKVFVFIPAIVFFILSMHMFKVKQIFQINTLLCFQIVIVLNITIWAIQAIYLSYLQERNVPDFKNLEQRILRGVLKNADEILDQYENIIYGPKPISWVDEKISMVVNQLDIVKHETLNFILTCKNNGTGEVGFKKIKTHQRNKNKILDKIETFMQDISRATNSGCFDSEEMDVIDFKFIKIKNQIKRLKLLTRQEEKIVNKAKGNIVNERPSATRP